MMVLMRRSATSGEHLLLKPLQALTLCVNKSVLPQDVCLSNKLFSLVHTECRINAERPKLANARNSDFYHPSEGAGIRMDTALFWLSNPSYSKDCCGHWYDSDVNMRTPTSGITDLS